MTLDPRDRRYSGALDRRALVALAERHGVPAAVWIGGELYLCRSVAEYDDDLAAIEAA